MTMTTMPISMTVSMTITPMTVMTTNITTADGFTLVRFCFEDFETMMADAKLEKAFCDVFLLLLLLLL